ncbi:MAG: beta-galactosidase [Phycisphaerae bacterium]|nr:MAG: beta-galactosidase [Phycisphaerae bacterium]
MHVIASFVVGVVLGASAAGQTDNIGHTRHTHHHNPRHETDAPTAARFVTTRKSEIVLPLPQEKDAFVFAVFGDRTGGPASGVAVLADAVRDVNLVEPDLVMTVGDLIQGYNTTEPWLKQCEEYKGIMNELRCPWFPVSGNHDIYWRGPGKPPGEHEADYEANFGPLWYAFRHKNCWFIALYSDEGNPATGEKDFGKPDAQRMSAEQFAFLKDTLAKAKDADHVFIFLHHPRWLGGGYGDDWDRVHALLKSAGNVTAVFAGHIHRMRYDPRDGIEYVTLATVGGAQSSVVPDAGWLHHYQLVTVRKNQVAMASFPVGAAMDVRELTGELANQCAAMADTPPRIRGVLEFDAQGAVRRTVTVTVKNPTTREADVTVMPDSADARWVAVPDHRHGRVAAGASGTFEFEVRRGAFGMDEYLRPMEFVVDADVLMPGHRYTLPTRRHKAAMSLGALPGPTAPATNQGLKFDGASAVRVWNDRFELPDGPFTLEARFKANAWDARTGLVCKTESSEYGLFVSRGVPNFTVNLAGKYVEAGPGQAVLRTGVWHHVAGVFDGAEVRLYVDGRLTSHVQGSGPRTPNALPLIIGGDVGADGNPMSFFKGVIDGVRLSRGALYEGEAFTPPVRLEAGDATVLLTNVDALPAGYLWLERPHGVLGEVFGKGAAVVGVE